MQHRLDDGVEQRLCQAYIEYLEALERTAPLSFATLSDRALADLHDARFGKRPSISGVLDSLSERSLAPPLTGLAVELEAALDEFMPRVFVELGAEMFSEESPLPADFRSPDDDA